MLPNPNYGGWERAAHGWNDRAKPATKLELKLKQLGVAAGDAAGSATKEADEKKATVAKPLNN